MNELKKHGAVISAYDPVVQNYSGINICTNMEDCVSAADIVITATEWKIFADMDPGLLENKMVFDLRRVLDLNKVNITMGVGIGKN